MQLSQGGWILSVIADVRNNGVSARQELTVLPYVLIVWSKPPPPLSLLDTLSYRKALKINYPWDIIPGTLPLGYSPAERESELWSCTTEEQCCQSRWIWTRSHWQPARPGYPSYDPARPRNLGHTSTTCHCPAQPDDIYWEGRAPRHPWY